MCQHVCDFVFMYVHILVTLAAGVCTHVSGGWACICVPVCWCNDCNMNFRIIHHVSLKTPRGARNKTIYTDETPRTPSPHLHFNLMWTVGNYLHCQRTPRMLFPLHLSASNIPEPNKSAGAIASAALEISPVRTAELIAA